MEGSSPIDWTGESGRKHGGFNPKPYKGKYSGKAGSSSGGGKPPKKNGCPLFILQVLAVPAGTWVILERFI